MLDESEASFGGQSIAARTTYQNTLIMYVCGLSRVNFVTVFLRLARKLPLFNRFGKPSIFHSKFLTFQKIERPL